MKILHTLNLQRFADPNTQTTLLNAVGNDLSPEMKTFYKTALIRTAKPNLVHTQFGLKRPIPKGNGKKVEWRKWSNFKKALTPLTEGVTPDGNTLNVSYIEAEVAQYGDYTTVSDILELTAVDPVIVEVTEKHGDNAGLTLDTIARNELIAGTQVRYAPKVSGGTETVTVSRYQLDKNCLMTGKLVRKAVTDLKAVNAPKINGSYVSIIHPHVGYDISGDTEWVEASKYAGATQIFEGELGKFHSCRFVESTEAAVFKGKPLTSEAETLTVKTAVEASTGTATSDVAVNEAIASSDRIASASSSVPVNVVIGDTKLVVVGVTTGAAGAAKLTVKQPHGAIAAKDKISAGDAGKDNLAVYASLFLGKDAYATIDIEGGGTEVIVKPKGSAGTADPLNQRSTIGWKSLFACKRLIEEYILRVETCSEYSDEVTEAN